jgi:hypothetical protein
VVTIPVYLPFGPEGKRIGDTTKPMRVRTIGLKYTPNEMTRYRPLHNFTVNNIIKCINEPDVRKVVAFDMKHWRALKHYSTWLRFEYLLEYHVDKLQEFRTDRRFALRKLAELICEENSDLSPPGESLKELLGWFANGSPKLR